LRWAFCSGIAVEHGHNQAKATGHLWKVASLSNIIVIIANNMLDLDHSMREGPTTRPDIRKIDSMFIQ
jgi:hypothetical protein